MPLHFHEAGVVQRVSKNGPNNRTDLSVMNQLDPQLARGQRTISWTHSRTADHRVRTTRGEKVIRLIQRPQGFGVFQDLRKTNDLPEFGAKNIIYGWNYSGKTTLSRLFRRIRLRNSIA